MPVPFIVSLLASLAGAGFNANIQNQATSEQNRQNQLSLDRQRTARDAERDRQLEFERGQAQSAANALTRADPGKVAETVAAQAAAPDNPFVQTASEFRVPKLSSALPNETIDTTNAATTAESQARLQTMLKAASMLSGQGTEFGSIGDVIARSGSNIATTGTKRRGSLGASGLETSIQPATVTPSSSILGDLLMLGGSLGAGAAGKSVGAAGGAKPWDINNLLGGLGIGQPQLPRNLQGLY